MSIKESTMKEIFATSGNLCALCLHEGRQTLLVDGKGHFISEIAHIRAQNKNGPRYDASYRDVDDACNLIPLCNNCHEKIDKYPNEYTVDYLEKLKRNHEAKFTTVIRDLATIHDVTKANNAIYPRSLQCLYGNELTESERSETLEYYKIFIDDIKSLPADCRKFLEVCLERARGKKLASLTQEIEGCLRLSSKECYSLYSTCHNYGFVDCDKEDDNNYYFYLKCPSKIGFNVFQELSSFSKEKEVNLSVFFENLDFSSLG